MTQPAKWLTLPQLNSTCSYWRHSACKNKSGSSKISTYLMVEINCKVFKIYWYVCCWPRPRKVCARVRSFGSHHLTICGLWQGFALLPRGWGGEGGWSTPQSLIQEGSSRRFIPYPFTYHFYSEGTRFVYLLLTNGTPFTYIVRTLHPVLTALNVRSFDMNKSLN